MTTKAYTYQRPTGSQRLRSVSLASALLTT